ncbi:hypothetical protein BJX63DRAFT_429693 [Aspergillus granulosus]|uniref:Zn(2)-C6 fungal-type domain-containing protein n=1 Tax=Aspergillus granulosus TaxID=176169 RepID=A0ABR4HQL8_9EURO
MASHRPKTRSMGTATGDVDMTDAPIEAPSTAKNAVSGLNRMQINDRKKDKNKGTAGSAVTTRAIVTRAAASGGPTTRSGLRRAGTPLASLPMTTTSTKPSTSAIIKVGANKHAAMGAGAPQSGVRMPPPPCPARTMRLAHGFTTRVPTTAAVSGHEMTSAIANTNRAGHIPHGGLAMTSTYAMVRRAAATGTVRTTPSGTVTTRGALRRATAGSAASEEDETTDGSNSGGAAPGAFAPPHPPSPSGSGDGGVDMDDSHSYNDDEVNGDSSEETEDKVMPEQANAQTTHETAAAEVGKGPWDEPEKKIATYFELPPVVYELPTAAEMQRIIENYKRYKVSHIRWTKWGQSMYAWREWLQMSGLWDGVSSRPEAQFEIFVRLLGGRAPPDRSRGKKNKDGFVACDRCLLNSHSSTGCRLLISSGNACIRCINAQLPCSFTDHNNATIFFNGAGNEPSANLGGKNKVVPGHVGQNIVQVRLPRPLEPYLPPPGLPTVPGSYAHPNKAENAKSRARLQCQILPAPVQDITGGYETSDLSSEEDSDDIESEDLIIRKQGAINATNPGRRVDIKLTLNKPPRFFPVPSRRQLHRILGWWSRHYSNGRKNWDALRKSFLAYAQWAHDNGWWDGRTTRFEVHYNVLIATRGESRLQLGATTCDRCIAHAGTGKCGTDGVINACKRCITLRVPCTLTNAEATHTAYLNGGANAVNGVEVVQGGQHVSFVNERIPRQAIFSLMGPSARKYLKAKSARALPPPLPARAQVPAQQPLSQPSGPPPALRPPGQQEEGREVLIQDLQRAQRLARHWTTKWSRAMANTRLLSTQFNSLGILPNVSSQNLTEPVQISPILLSDPVRAASVQAHYEEVRYRQQLQINGQLEGQLVAMGITPATEEAAAPPSGTNPTPQILAPAPFGNPFSPMVNDHRLGQLQTPTDNTAFQETADTRPPKRRKTGQGLTLGRTKLFDPNPAKWGLQRQLQRGVDQANTDQAPARPSNSSQAITGQANPRRGAPRPIRPWPPAKRRYDPLNRAIATPREYQRWEATRSMSDRQLQEFNNLVDAPTNVDFDVDMNILSGVEWDDSGLNPAPQGNVAPLNLFAPSTSADANTGQIITQGNVYAASNTGSVNSFGTNTGGTTYMGQYTTPHKEYVAHIETVGALQTGSDVGIDMDLDTNNDLYTERNDGFLDMLGNNAQFGLNYETSVGLFEFNNGNFTDGDNTYPSTQGDNPALQQENQGGNVTGDLLDEFVNFSPERQ